jgi:hypothetical protein
MMSVKENIYCDYAVWRKGKWLVGILVLKLDKESMYIRGLILLLFCLSFFPPHATSCILIQYNYIPFLSLLPSPFPHYLT